MIDVKKTGLKRVLTPYRKAASAILALLLLTILVPSTSAQTPILDPAQDKFVHVGDIDVAYQEFGSGEPLVMIMGYAGSLDLWSPRLIQRLSDSYRVIVFDNRGMGRSQSSEQEYTIPLFAADTLGLMDALGIEKAAVLGYSMGTDIAQELVLTRPDRVEKLVLLAGTPGGNEKIPTRPEGMGIFTDNSGTPQDRGMRLIRALFPNAWLQKNPNIPSYFPVRTTINPVENCERQYRAIQNWSGSFSRLGQIMQPTLVITGEDDVIDPPDNSDLLVKAISDAWLVRLRGVGHGLIFQYPDLIAQEVVLFLQEAP